MENMEDDLEEKKALAGGPDIRYGGVAVAISQDRKVGANCCGCCCDMRRATIFVSILFMSFSALSVVMLLGAESIRVTTKDSFDDDVLLDVLEESYFTQCIFVSIGLVSSTCSLCGALKYNAWMVVVNIVWMVVVFFASLIIEILAYNEILDNYAGTEDLKLNLTDNFFGAIVTIFWIYPLASFIREVRVGIMSKETYPREEFSCCCTRRRY